MRLPFTPEQFFDIFAAYNAALWPGVIALRISSFAVCALIVASPRRSDRLICALLVTHWAWSGFLYHGTFFAQINPAAWLFMALFLIEAGLFFWRGLIQERLRFTQTRSMSTMLAWMFIAYTLLIPRSTGPNI